MGLLSKVKNVTGSLKARATSAIGALRATKVGSVGGKILSSPAGRVTTKLGTTAFKLASPIAKISTVLGVGSLAVKGVKAASRKVKEAAASRAGRTTAGAIAGGAALGAALKNNPQQKTSLVNRAISYAKANPVKTGLAVAGAAAVGYGIYKAVTRKKRKKSTKRKTKRKSSRRRSTRRTTRSRTRRKRGYGTERQYKRRGGLDVKYTKNGQPYVIQSNGRARFVKRSKR